MVNIQAASEIASQVLGDDVIFFCDERSVPVRATVWGRWVTPVEWARLRRAGLDLPPKVQRAPRRRRKEAACPCPGCGFCVCKWVGDGRRHCQRALCICQRERPPARLVIAHLSRERSELELRRGARVLALLGVWSPTKGWDFTVAGDARARSLPKVMPLLLARTRLERVMLDEPLPPKAMAC